MCDFPLDFFFNPVNVGVNFNKLKTMKTPIELNMKRLDFFGDEILFNAIQDKLLELGFLNADNMSNRSVMNFAEVCVIDISNGRFYAVNIESPEYEEIDLAKLFKTQKVSVETIEIGGRKYSKKDVEDRLKNLEEVE